MMKMSVAVKNYDTSSLDRTPLVLPTAGVPSIPRDQDELTPSITLPKPELSSAQRALIELRSLHGHKHVIRQIDRQRITTGDRDVTGISHSSTRGRRSYKPGSNPNLMKDVTNSRNLYHNDTVKHLMHQLSEINNITYGRITGKTRSDESFCSEMTLQSRKGDDLIGFGEKENDQYLRSEGGANNPRSHNVMKMIERQILRDLRHHISKSVANKDKNKQKDDSSDTKTHSEELPGGMKVVIKKTTRRDGQRTEMSRSGDGKSRKNDLYFPSINKTAPGGTRKKQSEKYEWSLDDTRVHKSSLPAMNGVVVHGQSNTQVTDNTARESANRRQKSNTQTRVDGGQPSLPKIQEEPDTTTQASSAQGEAKTTRDTGTHCAIAITKNSPTPTNDSPIDTKVKLPILGKSIGQHRELNYEGGSKFMKPSLGEIKRIIHGLYGDYFDSTLERYYTYEKQLNDTKMTSSESETPVHYVTPALDDSESPAASHTLQLFKSASKRFDENHPKHQKPKMSVPIIRAKHGQALANPTNKKADRSEDHKHKVQERTAHSQPITSNGRITVVDTYTSFLRERMPNQLTEPKTPNEKVLLSHIAHQVALYHEQIARENRSLHQDENNSDVRYLIEGIDSQNNLHQFTEDIDRYAQYLETYLEAKQKHSQERKAKLKEIKGRQREKKLQKNKHLEVVEHRDAFLAQLQQKNNFNLLPKTPKTPANTTIDDVEGDISFEYIHSAHRYDQTPDVKIKSSKSDKVPDVNQDKQAMGTKIYRIFGERKKSASTIRRWVAQAPIPYTSRAIKRQVSRSSKDTIKTLIAPQPRHMRHRSTQRPTMMSDLVSRFQVATRYKLDREYVASLASGTT